MTFNAVYVFHSSSTTKVWLKVIRGRTGEASILTSLYLTRYVDSPGNQNLYSTKKWSLFSSVAKDTTASSYIYNTIRFNTLFLSLSSSPSLPIISSPTYLCNVFKIVRVPSLHSNICLSSLQELAVYHCCNKGAWEPDVVKKWEEKERVKWR